MTISRTLFLLKNLKIIIANSILLNPPEKLFIFEINIYSNEINYLMPTTKGHAFWISKADGAPKLFNSITNVSPSGEQSETQRIKVGSIQMHMHTRECNWPIN